MTKSRKYNYLFSILLFILSAINCIGQTTNNLTQPKYIRVIEAYGFLTGQEYSLDLIKKKFPKVERNVLKAQLSFNITFGKSKERIEKYFAEYLGQNQFKEYQNKLISEIENMQGNQIFTEEIASKYIEDVESRAKGNIESTVLETLLSFQFSDSPEAEYTSGFTTVFRTKGHPKSKNTDWQIKVPKSWKEAEADRPNIIKKFVSDYGSGNEGILLMVKNLPLEKGEKITKAEINEFFSDKVIRTTVDKGEKFISFTKMILDNNIGGMLEIEQIIERLDHKMKIRMLNFMFIRDDKMYSLQCSIYSEKVNLDLSIEMKKFFPLYKLVANSIVVNDQYK